MAPHRDLVTFGHEGQSSNNGAVLRTTSNGGQARVCDNCPSSHVTLPDIAAITSGCLVTCENHTDYFYKGKVVHRHVYIYKPKLNQCVQLAFGMPSQKPTFLDSLLWLSIGLVVGITAGVAILCCCMHFKQPVDSRNAWNARRADRVQRLGISPDRLAIEMAMQEEYLDDADIEAGMRLRRLDRRPVLRVVKKVPPPSKNTLHLSEP